MKNRTSILFGILALGLALRVFSITTETLHPWDERYHALVAKNCIDNPLKPTLYKDPVLGYDYRSWTANHVWIHKQPIPIWTIAGSLALFGTSAVNVRIPSLLLSLLMIYLTYLIGKRLFNESIGLIASLLHAINWITISLVGGWTATDHYDVFFTAFIELAIWLFLIYAEKRQIKYLLLGSFIIGLAIMTKWLPALLVIGLWWIYDLKSKSFQLKRQLFETAIVIGVVGATFLPWQIYIQATFPLESAWESAFNFRHITEALEGHEHNWSFHLEFIGRHYGELVYIPAIVLLFRLFTRKASKEELLIIHWILVPYLFFTFVKTKMQGYTLISSPAIFIAISYLVVILFKKRPIGLKNNLFRVVGFCLVAFPVFHTVQWTVSTQKKKARMTNQELILPCDYCDSSIVLNLPEPISAMFFHDVIAYSVIPTDYEIDQLLEKGYNLIINEGENIHAGLRKRKDITILDLQQTTHRTHHVE